MIAYICKYCGFHFEGGFINNICPDCHRGYLQFLRGTEEEINTYLKDNGFINEKN